MIASPCIRKPRTTATKPLTAVQVASAYSYSKLGTTGRGCTIGIIELGGAYVQSDLAAYFAGLNLPVPTVTSTGTQKSDPQGADGEVALDIQVAGAVAPGARQRVYFADNTDQGFADAISRSVADQVTVIAISWGGPETQWASKGVGLMEAALSSAKAAGIPVCVAAGDSGADDGTGKPVTDYPASSPNVVACGGTRLTVTSTGARAAETTWDDSDTSSATGGGVSEIFPGRDVPDVAGNADPDSGYEIVLHGSKVVVGGTSAVAPLYAGLICLLTEALGHPVGDFTATVAANPTVCYDVEIGQNGAYRAGPGRDETTGFGVVDAARMLAVLKSPTPTPAPTPTNDDVTITFAASDKLILDAFAADHKTWHAAQAWERGTIA